MASEKPQPADTQSADLVFVSYAHADADEVYPDIVRLQEGGKAVWYDQGISPGSRWTQEIADAIEGASVFIAFISPRFVASENCINEVEFAVNKGRRILQIYLEPTDIPTGVELSLAGRQAILRHELDVTAYGNDLLAAVSSLQAEDDSGVQSRSGRVASSHSRGWLMPALFAAFLLALVVTFVNRDRSVEPVSSAADAIVAPAEELRPALAVLPFEDETATEEGQHLARGIADDLIIRLGAWQALPVVSRVASFAENLPADTSALGEALDARYLVRGRLYMTGDGRELRIYVVDASTGRDVWSGNFAAGVAYSRQEEVVDAIVGVVSPALLASESVRAVRANAKNVDAWTAAMRGWWHMNTETREGLDESRVWFAKAIELDPSWGWPHAANALSHFQAIYNGWTDDQRASAGAVIESSTAAINLDAKDPFAHHAYGHGLAVQGRIDDALRSLARGVELSPHDAMANGCLGMQLAGANRGDEALGYAKAAMAISPEDPWLHRFALVEARAHFASANYEESEAAALRSQQLRPSFGAFLHSVAAPALGDGLERATQRVEQAQAQGGLPPVKRIRAGFSTQTHEDYVERLAEGLMRAGFPE